MRPKKMSEKLTAERMSEKLTQTLRALSELPTATQQRHQDTLGAQEIIGDWEALLSWSNRAGLRAFGVGEGRNLGAGGG